MTEVDYGPLLGLIGEWRGDRGLDKAPENSSPEKMAEAVEGMVQEPYHEHLLCEAAGLVGNADEQNLAIVRYRQQVFRHSTGEQFHDEQGYWLWDNDRELVMHSLLIPRGLSLLAGGSYRRAEVGALLEFEVMAEADHAEWSIAQSPFLQEKAKTTRFEKKLTLDGDDLHYFQTTFLDIYGRKVAHTDENRLRRV